MSRICTALLVALATLYGCAFVTTENASPAASEARTGPDFSGRWLPDPSRAQPWPDPLPLTPLARTQLAAFVPERRDPTYFCMPFGTPRNTLGTEFPMEIVQTPERLTMIFQPDLSNAEVRRIHLDGRPLPAEPDAGWFGTSVGRWEGAVLVIETVGIDPDVIVSGNGLLHSGALRIVERLSLIDDPQRGKVLLDEMTLEDPQAYTEPLRTRRYFTWAPGVQFRDSHCGERLWIEKLWRDRLEEHATKAKPE